MQTRRWSVVPLCTLAFAIGCGGDSSGPPAVSTVDVTASGGSSITIGQSVSLTATPRDAKGNALTGRTVTWSSSNVAIATVTSGGVVSGVSVGSATITASVGGKSGTLSVNVLPPPVATVSVTAAAATIQVGQTTQATAVLRDASNTVLTGRAIAWGTSDPAVATVSNTGLITGVAGGNVTISATSEGKSGSVAVTVTAGNPADAPQISAITPTQLVEGQSATITGTKFGASPAENVVRVGGVAASVTAATATSISFVVPKLDCRPPGNVNVNVTVGGLTSAPKAQAYNSSVAALTLALGQQQVIKSPTDFCLQFAATGATEKYLIGVQSVSENVTSVTPAKVTAEVPAAGAVASRVVRAPAIATAPVFSASLINPFDDARGVRLSMHHATEVALLEQDRALFTGRFGAMHARAQTSRASRATLAAPPTVPATAKVGDVLTIRMPNRNSSSTCLNSVSLTVTVKALGAHGIILEDNANPAGGFSATDYQAFSDRFDSQIYATDIGYFGEPTDLDNNSHVAIVITKEVNKTANLLGEVLFADLDPDECPAGNSGEFFYGKAPDPNGTLGTAYSVANALNDAPIIIAHEFSHVIQVGRRVNYPPATALQSTWELEGQATFAEEVNGYTATGLGPGQNLGRNIALNTPATQPIDWFSDPFVDLAVYYGFQTRTTRISGAPEQCSWLGTQSQGNTGPCLAGREPYGVPWSFLRYLSDQFGSQFPDGEKGLHRALIDNAFSGYATISSVVGQPIDVLLARWAATLYTDDRFPGIDPKLTMPSWNLVSVEQGLVEPAHLVPYDRPFGAFSDQVSVRGGSTAYFLVSGAGRSATGIRVRDGSDGPLPAAMQLWVVRVQ